MVFNEVILSKKFEKKFLPKETEVEINFVENLNNFIEEIDSLSKNNNSAEENYTTELNKFLSSVLGKDFKIDYKKHKVKSGIDLHIIEKNSQKSNILIEVKVPNSSEMITKENLNNKALHQILFYSLREIYELNNDELVTAIVTDAFNWFIFDVRELKKEILEGLKNKFNKWTKKETNDDETKSMYNQIEIFLKENPKYLEQLEIDYFNIRDFENNKDKLPRLYNVLREEYLLRKKTIADPNELNEKFYNELLYILGLEEIQKDNKPKIERLPKEKRQSASLIENVIQELDSNKKFDNYSENKKFEIAFELCITWINRILFLKLLESQLYSYHNNNKEYKFFSNIKSFNEINTLFFKVFAKKENERYGELKTRYMRLPYLNSSLFEKSQLEEKYLDISNLIENTHLPLYSKSELKKNELIMIDKDSTIEYLLKFLDSYDFSKDKDEVIDSEKLITSSVLGLIFEKINGYQDGAVFTPSYITIYMAKDILHKTVIDKFNDKYNETFYDIDSIEEFISLKLRKIKIKDEKIDLLKEFNKIIDSLKICDPAVGSGHFLVSMLNEIIALKSKLGILYDDNTGNRFLNYKISNENDDLKIVGDDNIFKYKVKNEKIVNDRIERTIFNECTKIQKLIFEEKRKIITSCLFGVDINSKSVLISLLRLWIELLKHTYYREEDNYSTLEILPNLDINVKQGNSLISRFDLTTDLSKVFKKHGFNSDEYKEAVKKYKETSNRKDKDKLIEYLDKIKKEFRAEFKKGFLQNIQSLENEIKQLESNYLHGTDNETKKIIKDKENKLVKLKDQKKEIENNLIYENAFEWRFEFPEILDKNGNFIGFDIVIGNPPYGISLKDDLRKIINSSLGKVPDYEIYYYFIELSKKLLKKDSIKSFIIPNTILFNLYAEKYRKNLFDDWAILEILDCTNFSIFKKVTVRNIIITMKKTKDISYLYYRKTKDVKSFNDLMNKEKLKCTNEYLLLNNKNWGLAFKLDKNILDLVKKIEKDKFCIKELFPDISQGLIPYDKYRGQSKHIIENRIYHYTTFKKGLKKCLWGEDVNRYYIKWNEKEYIDYCNGIANPREPKFFNENRILVREITNPRILAGLTNEELYNDPSIIIILDNNEQNYNIKVLLGILNSKLATFYHFNSSPKATKGLFPKILVDDIRNFPIPKVSEEEQKPFIKLVDEILKAKEKGEDTKDFEDEIDKRVYKLYAIDENTEEGQKEIELIKNSIKE